MSNLQQTFLARNDWNCQEEIKVNELIIENTLYEVGVDCRTGYYMFKTHVKSKYTASFHKYTVYPPVGSHQCTHGIFGCVYISSEIKFIEIENCTAIYYGETPFDLCATLFDAERATPVYSNEIVDIIVHSVDLTTQYFSGAEQGILFKQCTCSINNHLLWVGLIEISSYKNSSLSHLGIKNNTINKSHAYGKKGIHHAGTQEFGLDYFYDDINSCHVYNDANTDLYWYLVELPRTSKPDDDIKLDWMMCNKAKKKLQKAGYTFHTTYAKEILRLEELFHLYTDIGIDIDIEAEIESIKTAPDFLMPCIKFLEDMWQEKKKRDILNIKKSEITFPVAISYDRQYYCAAKLADNAKHITKDSIRDVYYVTFDSRQIHEIALMYHNFRTVYNEAKDRAIDTSSFVKKYIFEEFLLAEISLYIEKARGKYAYYNFVTNSVLVRMRTTILKNKNSELALLHARMLDEKRVLSLWSNEYKLFTLVKTFVSDAIFQYHCDWLGDQSFDIFLPSDNIAIEYQGRQHYEAVDFFGGDEALASNQERDARKLALAETNGVKVIEWAYVLPVDEDNVEFILEQNGVSVADKTPVSDIISKPITGLVMAPVQENKVIKRALKPSKPKVQTALSSTVIRQYNTDGHFLNEFDTINLASEQTTISERAIKKCVYGERKTGGGLLWKRVDRFSEKVDIDALVIERRDQVPKAILQYDLDDKLIAEFPSLRQASSATAVNQRGISDALKGIQKTAGGFCWKYK